MRERLEALVAREHERVGAEFLAHHPIEPYLSWFSSPETVGNYNGFPGSLRPWFDAVRRDGGLWMLSAYHRLAMAELMRRSWPRLDGEELAPGIARATREWLEGLVEKLESEPDIELDADDDFFKKDVSVCALRMLVTRGPCHLEVAHLSRRFLVSGGPKQALRGLACYARDLRFERYDLYGFHLEDRRIYPHFLEDGWLRTYEDIAEQMRRQPRYVALHATGWFWDPHVREVSPKLAYIVDFPARGGAHFFRLGPSESARADALSDRKRRQAYEAGEYVPTAWIMIWPRAALLAHVGGQP